MKTYNQSQAAASLDTMSLAGWKPEGDFIHKVFTFKDFKEAIQFMVKVGEIAEELNHHPNWNNVYNKVSIKLSTHDAKGITDKDFELARRIEVLFKS